MFGTNLSAQESVCYGTTAEGRLKGGVELAYEGKNYLGYSRVARMAGRNYVHSAVKTIIVKAYRQLEIEQPDKVYKYAETGFEQGGRFKPHKTHQNGLSVDFMTPVVDKEGLSVHLPTHPFNRFGYDIEFDKNSEAQLKTVNQFTMTNYRLTTWLWLHILLNYTKQPNRRDLTFGG